VTFLFQEHSFEVSLFAELFNEMLMRDFGFRIYRALNDAPERAKEDEKVTYAFTFTPSLHFTISYKYYKMLNEAGVELSTINSPEFCMSKI